MLDSEALCGGLHDLVSWLKVPHVFAMSFGALVPKRSDKPRHAAPSDMDVVYNPSLSPFFSFIPHQSFPQIPKWYDEPVMPPPALCLANIQNIKRKRFMCLYRLSCTFLPVLKRAHENAMSAF
jgi:hypothetical protein